MNIRKATYFGTVLSAAALTMSMVANATVNTVGQLTCASNEVALFNGEVWICSDVTVEQQATIDSLVEENVAQQEAIDALVEENVAQQETIDALVLAVETLTGRLDALENDNQALTDRLACVKDESNDTELIFEGCNVHVRNTAGQTDAIDGLGNLIVGYNEDGGETRDRTGSHNLIIGAWHSYSGYGGLVAGFENTIASSYASVTGGVSNEALGPVSSVSGGQRNQASGLASSVSGGAGNSASGDNSSVSGGEINVAEGNSASISGGAAHFATSYNSSISGGLECTVDVPDGWGVGDASGTTGCVMTNLP